MKSQSTFHHKSSRERRAVGESDGHGRSLGHGNDERLFEKSGN